jgi:anti-sigma B factor antagonist
MGEFRRIETSKWESGERHVAVVEILDEKLSGPTLMQELAQELSTFLDEIEHKHIMLNLARVEFISSAALNRLINFQKHVHQAGGRLVLCRLRPSIETVFVTTRLNQVFEIQKSETEAFASF